MNQQKNAVDLTEDPEAENGEMSGSPAQAQLSEKAEHHGEQASSHGHLRTYKETS